MDPAEPHYGEDSSPNGVITDQSLDSGIQAAGEALQARGYQLEMLEESLRRNIIIAMDTGSGKTFMYCRLAWMPTLAEPRLEQFCEYEQNSRGVTLVRYVYYSFRLKSSSSSNRIPYSSFGFAYRVYLLHISNTEPSVLNYLAIKPASYLVTTIVSIGVNIPGSKYSKAHELWCLLMGYVHYLTEIVFLGQSLQGKVLLQALGHAFVKMSGLALLIFDEGATDQRQLRTHL
ncbi:MAG: hypothetical protein Q9217_000801 [Psora testacea]